VIRGQVALIFDIARRDRQRVIYGTVEEGRARSNYKIARIDDHFDASTVAVGRILYAPVEARTIAALLIVRVARVTFQIVIGQDYFKLSKIKREF
jgi:hypothetical protein